MTGGSPDRDGDVGNLVFDLDGVLYLAGTGIAGTGDALHALDAAGYRLLFATNNSTTEASGVAARIERLCGYPARVDQVVSSAMAAAAMAGPDDAPAFVLGEPGLEATLQSHGIALTDDPHSARSVFVGLDRDTTYARMRDAATAVLNGARFISTNSDLTFPTADGLWPGGGALAAVVELTAGVAPEIAGKPHPPMRQAVAARLGPGPTWMIGDRAETDLAFGIEAGWRTILVLTGVTSDPGDVPPEFAPDIVVDSVADVPAALGSTTGSR